jgi:hypothetical protein
MKQDHRKRSLEEEVQAGFDPKSWRVTSRTSAREAQAHVARATKQTKPDILTTKRPLDRLTTHVTNCSRPLIHTKPLKTSQHVAPPRRRPQQGPPASNQLHLQTPAATQHRANLALRTAGYAHRGQDPRLRRIHEPGHRRCGGGQAEHKARSQPTGWAEWR